MKILCVSDHIDPLVYSSSIKSRFRNVDLILGAGDLPLEYYGYIVSLLNKPLLFVFGNHNLSRFQYYKYGPKTGEDSWLDRIKFSHNFGATYIGDKVKKVGPLLIGGLGGSRRYNKGENQYTEFQMFLKALKLIPKMLWNRLVHGRYLDILLTHASPRGIHDKPDLCHTGFKVFLWFMRQFKPKYLIHGHIHLYDLNAIRRTKYYRTMVVNCYDHILLEFEADQNG